MTLSAPVWIVALALAAVSPWCVRALADRLELRVRRRTEALVARARGTRDAPVPLEPFVEIEKSQGVDSRRTSST